MIAEGDIWDEARRLVREHGDDATIIAAQRVDALLAAGEIALEIDWKKILACVELLLRERPSDGERVR